MDSGSKEVGLIIPSEERSTGSKLNESLRNSENVDPNVPDPGFKSNSPSSMKLEESAKKSDSVKPKFNQVALVSSSPKKKIQQRKFVIVKKKLRSEEVSSSIADAFACEKCKKAIGKSKCFCVAYEKLRASQEEFFKNRNEIEGEDFDELDAITEKEGCKTEVDEGSVEKIDGNSSVLSQTNLETNDDGNEVVVNRDMVSKSRDRLLEEERADVSIPGFANDMQLVKEFEKILKFGNSEEREAEKVKHEKELPGLQQPPKDSECHGSSSSCCPSDFILTSESLGLDNHQSYSLDSSKGSFSRLSSAGNGRLRQSSTDSLKRHARRYRKEKLMKTSQKPFMLRTEERGQCKMEKFMKKLQKMLEEEEKMRIPIAQGLPWTTDEPEHLVKPPVKESTKPIDLVLHSELRAVDRSEFDHQVGLKMELIEQYRMERERQRKLEEEEGIRRLRKELIPKAQPMPYFDRPFIPRRSSKLPTIPKEPKFHIPPQRKTIQCLSSLGGFHSQQQDTLG